jgi:universal stress protein F
VILPAALRCPFYGLSCLAHSEFLDAQRVLVDETRTPGDAEGDPGALPSRNPVIRRILAAVGSSDSARHVVARAIGIARSARASVRLYQGVAVPAEFPPAAPAHADILRGYLLTTARERLAGLAALYPDVVCEVVVDESHHPPHAILHAADVYDADLIIIGSHGYEAIDRLLGTTAAKVVNTARRDVLVVHGKYAA